MTGRAEAWLGSGAGAGTSQKSRVMGLEPSEPSLEVLGSSII